MKGSIRNKSKHMSHPRFNSGGATRPQLISHPIHLVGPTLAITNIRGLINERPASVVRAGSTLERCRVSKIPSGFEGGARYVYSPLSPSKSGYRASDPATQSRTCG